MKRVHGTVHNSKYPTMGWTINEYCSSQQASDLSKLAESTRQFLTTLNLPVIHPFCGPDAPQPYNLEGVPAQGPLLHHYHLETAWDKIVSASMMAFPTVLAMAELWFRFFAAFLAPIGLIFMLRAQYNKPSLLLSKKEREELERQRNRKGPWDDLWYSALCIVTTAASVVVLTDPLYTLEFGSTSILGTNVCNHGLAFMSCSVYFSLKFCLKHKLSQTRLIVLSLLALALYLAVDWEAGAVSFGGKVDWQPTNVPEGLYYDNESSFATRLVDEWPSHTRSYTRETGSTKWMSTGDARTALPFLLNRVPAVEWTRVWLPVQDGEVIGLDFCFPPSGYDSSKPVYLVLHGLNGGSDEQFVKDFALKRRDEGVTTVVMIARGLMDLPVRGWNLFHGARWSDASESASALRKAMGKDQILAGVGYSMGGTFTMLFRGIVYWYVSCLPCSLQVSFLQTMSRALAATAS